MITPVRYALASGGFDPLHSGHIALIREAAKTTHGVVVLLNSDKWLTRKKGRPFMNWDERAAILSAISGVKAVLPVDDGDGTVCNGILKAKEAYGAAHLVFCNGGDRQASNTPETALCEALGIEVQWDVGGGKTSSSSEILSQWLTDDSADRPWGRWSVFRNFTTTKLKELVVEPGGRLSCQRHDKRSEFWFVAQGIGEAWVGDMTGHSEVITLKPQDTITIPKGKWHTLANIGTEPLHVIEIQYGELCVEEDILRWPDIHSLRILSDDELLALQQAISDK